jgi:O-antigen ligase
MKKISGKILLIAFCCCVFVLAGVTVSSGGLLFPLFFIILALMIISLKSPFLILMLVVFLTPLGFFTMISGATLTRYLSVILLVSAGANILNTRKLPRFDLPVALLGLWILFTLLSYLWSSTTNRLFENFFGYLLVYVVLISIVNLVNNQKRLAYILCVFLLGQFCYIAIYFLSGETNVSGFYLPTLGSSQLSEYGTWVGFIVACYLPVIFYGKPRYRIFALIVLILLVLLFFFTGLRRNILTTAFVIFTLLLFPRKPPWKAIILSIIIFSAVWISWGTIIDSLPNIIQQRFTFADVTTTGGTGRVTLFKIAFNLWLSSPIFGIGVGSYAYYADPIFRFAAVPHNVFLEVLCETGLVGFLLWTTAFLIVFWNTIVTFRSCDRYPDRLLTALPLAMMAYMFAGGMVSSMQNWRPLWIAMGLGIAVSKIFTCHPLLRLTEIEERCGLKR